jgi:formiminoglutamase
MGEPLHIIDFLDPVDLPAIASSQLYKHGQVGKEILAYHEKFPDLSEMDMVLVGCGEERGAGNNRINYNAPDAIRKQFYQLYHWHSELRLGDLGNIRPGAVLNDTYAALKMVLGELAERGKLAVVLGGSHDLTLAQYYSNRDQKKTVEAACVDALIDLNIDSLHRADNFLMEMLTDEPNFMGHYNHIGFQSFFVHPHILETMDKLRFDCFRVGSVKENIEEMEPVIRNSHLFSFDISAISQSYAPANTISPNGLNGEEACSLMRYAGLSPTVNTVGIYGYHPVKDHNQMTAMLIGQMLWYLADGRNRGSQEANLNETDSFVEYHTAFAEVQTSFLQSKRTNRWWMRLPNQKYIPCSYQDYLLASSNEIPERWLRAQERG